ncbi:hypothetical protein [Acinetobacter haemolyticus]|uniref:hypothetical protein n=1 Tax=Acinetobacter haemolyticus TaxID=29430 RepID=UPI000E57C377|nr:hypothetical protein [Acinetobacter haemolyticus]QDJ93762.1 hypothetical protein AhaeAN54_007175 [Acinetobacter haemolyticus]
MIWRAYCEKYGSLFFGRRIEQAFGNWMAHYTRYKVKEGVEIDPHDFMPHETPPVTTFEQERMAAIKRKQARS